MAASASDPLRRAEGGWLVRVRLTPNAAADRIDGVESAADGRAHLKCRVRAVPEKGAANAALEILLAKRLRIPKSSVSVIGGATNRVKTLRIEGDEALGEALAALLTGDGT